MSGYLGLPCRQPCRATVLRETVVWAALHWGTLWFRCAPGHTYLQRLCNVMKG